MIAVLLSVLATAAVTQPEVVGERPYEMVWANRTKDDFPPLIDFEDLTGWTVQVKNAEATFERTREQQIWGRYVGKLTYKGTAAQPEVRVLPPAPVRITTPFDAVSMWVFGNNWGWTPVPGTPQVDISLLFDDPDGKEFSVPLVHVNWEEWFLCYHRLSPDQIERVRNGATFKAIVITGGANKDPRTLFFDNLATFTEQFPTLKFKPRPERGIAMFPGETTGTNAGPGKLPFPIRPETILPANDTADYKTTLTMQGSAYVWTYAGADGKATWKLDPKTGMFDDLTAQWDGRGGPIKPCVGGGVYLAVGDKAVAPESANHLGTTRKGDEVVSRWRLTAGETIADVTYTYRMWGKSLVVDVVAPGGKVAEVHYGRAVGLQDPRLVTNPYYTMSWEGRPAVAVSGSAEAPLFLAGNTDWYLTGASMPFPMNIVDNTGVTYNGGTRYVAKTDGKRNDCFERLFLTLSPRYEEVLPTIANPMSPWKSVTGTHLWRAHGASDRAGDVAYWTDIHRYGMTEVVVTDHETMWRDNGESFTFRTKTAPKKGGDQGEADYSRTMQQTLGFVYGPYNNFTDFCPTNEFWSYDLIARNTDKSLQGAWFRCYAPKPARAVEYCDALSPINQSKYHFSTAYCDVHTAVAPWDRTDYDARVPGAGTCAATFYSYGEIMLLQKHAWNGPVYSEGGYHYMYCGLTDGNYGQDQNYKIWQNPWLVDFDLRKMHPLCCNFGIGEPGMFGEPQGDTTASISAMVDRFLAATVAFGHPGFLVGHGGMGNTLRSYYMLQQLHSRYCLSNADEIRYLDGAGKLHDVSSAVATGVYKRSQVVTRYADGTVTAANGSRTERLSCEAFGHKIDLPPNGYAGWTKDNQIEVVSGDPKGHRCDYARTPASIYVDGRGKFMRFPKAGGDGQGVCRILGGGKYEVILYNNADCGFAIDATQATALDKGGKEIGPAELRHARGLTYVVPVDKAFSYILTGAAQPAAGLTSDRDELVPGERAIVHGKTDHEFKASPNAKVGERLWAQFDGQWIDFTVVPLAQTSLALKGNDLVVSITSNLAQAEDFTVSAAGKTQQVRVEPGKPATVTFDLGVPQAEDAEVLTVDLKAGELHQSVERGLRTTNSVYQLMPLPDHWYPGMCVRGGQETTDMGETRAYATAQATTCNNVSKAGIFMHPPWMGAVGYTFAMYDAVTLPETPAAFRALVGKADGSDPGDGILYKVEVVDEDGTRTVAAEKTVTEHDWFPIEADLSKWAGKKIRLKLIADCGLRDDTSGDWSCWADMRIESLKPALIRKLDEDSEKYRREAGPYPVKGVTVADLRTATQGWIHYDGKGVEGTGEQYGSFAVLNGVELGHMTPAGGDETHNVFQEKVSVALTADALKTLGMHNVFSIRNPGQDSFSIRRFWIEVELADGRKCSSDISTATYTQPMDWLYAEGIGVPKDENITVDIWFKP